jgi:hypothetical protein
MYIFIHCSVAVYVYISIQQQWTVCQFGIFFNYILIENENGFFFRHSELNGLKGDILSCCIYLQIWAADDIFSRFKFLVDYIPGCQGLSWSTVVMDFQIIVEVLCQSFFECQNQFSRTLLTLNTLGSNIEGFLCMPYKMCWCVSRNWLCGSYANRSYRRNRHTK